MCMKNKATLRQFYKCIQSPQRFAGIYLFYKISCIQYEVQIIVQIFKYIHFFQNRLDFQYFPQAFLPPNSLLLWRNVNLQSTHNITAKNTKVEKKCKRVCRIHPSSSNQVVQFVGFSATPLALSAPSVTVVSDELATPPLTMIND